MREILVELESQKIAYSTEISFIDWIDRWMEQKKMSVRQSTYESYVIYLEAHIRTYFKQLKLIVRAIAPQHIQDYVNKKYKEGLSGSTIRKHMAVISGSLKDACHKNIISLTQQRKSYCLLKRNCKFYTAEQANKLLEVVKGKSIEPAVILGLFYGLRRSEVLGLRWKDIDFEKNTIYRG